MKYTEITFRDDAESPVAVEPYVSTQPPRIYRLDNTPVRREEQRRRPNRSVQSAITGRLPRARRRQSHRQRPGHRRVRASRAGPDDDVAPPGSPAAALRWRR